MCKRIREIGLRAFACCTTLDGLRTAEKPCIVLLERSPSLANASTIRRHFVVLFRVGVNGITISDPPRGVCSYEAELRKLVAVDLLILDDFAIDVLDPVESRDFYDLLLERYRTGSVIVTSNRGPDEWLATFADPVRAQSAIDRFTGNAYDLVIEGESYRPRLKPRLAKEGKERSR
jgi:hypothetical protein